MIVPSLLLMLQAVQAPVLAFPERGLDDPAAYQGYTTRFYRDAAGNTVQIYLEPLSGRVVHLWADAADESLGFTARDARGRPAPLAWGGDSSAVGDSGGVRWLEYRLQVRSPAATLGWFLLGSMRVERDFQYADAHRRPYTAPPYLVAEESLLVANVSRLPPGEQRRHLELLRAASVAELRSRIQPSLTAGCGSHECTVRARQRSLDGRNRLALEIGVDRRRATLRLAGRTVEVRARAAGPVTLSVRIATDAKTLTPLPRDSIFSDDFLAFLAGERSADSASARYRRLEREVRGVELLSSEEKLMAGLPSFATYFGRDMLMSALMMRPIWRPAMSEHVIASVLRKLSPRGDVSHEEALGGQAIRENAAEYNRLVAGCFGQSASVSCDSARMVLEQLQRTRENYYMLDDEFQLPILAARYLTDSVVPPERKRAFLLDTVGGATHLALLLRELGLVAAETRAYARDSRPEHLVSFVKRDSTHWRSASWRDSDAGYANGRFAMDINAIWAPRALAATGEILAALTRLGMQSQALDTLGPDLTRGPLGEYLADTAALDRAVATWRGAKRHFAVTLGPREIGADVRAKLASLRPAERAYWDSVLTATGAARDSLAFAALSLDSTAQPIPVVNTDPATELFLDASAGRTTDLGLLESFLRPYPVGLFIHRLGPVAANDAYAPPRVWDVFANDAYHSPRVVWGREVNLFLLGLAHLLDRAPDPGAARALHRTLEAVRASGLEHSELWSYRIERGRLIPTRYGTGSDVQLWSSTDLAVQYMLSRLPHPERP